MQRFLILLLCVCGCTLVGLRMAGRLKGRAEALTDMKNGILMLTSAIEHSNRPLDRIASDIAARSGAEFWKQFANRLSGGEDAGNAWRNALDTAALPGAPLHALLKNDLALLQAFSSSLGKTGRTAQTADGRQTAEALGALLTGADAQYAQKGRVYRVLGALMGIGLGILLW